MEFTYDGLVRCGFGFYNPNHAAALICAILPFTWILFLYEKLWTVVVGGVLSALLFVALSYTYSRSGLLVCALEIVLFIALRGRKYWKLFLILGVVLVIALLFSEGWKRLTFDSSALNRLDIWRAGILLFAANPMGVGLGNSGEIIGAFTLPEGIDCRTLINSHLTLLCEFGFIAGFVWIVLILYALGSGMSSFKRSKFKTAALISFCSLLVSSSLSTVFDWEVLINPSKFEYLTNMNLFCSYIVFFIFCALVVYLSWGRFRSKIFIPIFAACVFATILSTSSGRRIFPKVDREKEYIFVRDSDASEYCTALFDDDFDLKSAVGLLKKLGLFDGVRICSASWQSGFGLPRVEKFILIGSCSEFASGDKGLDFILINPPVYFRGRNKNISKIYVPRWDSRYDRIRDNFSEEIVENF